MTISRVWIATATLASALAAVLLFDDVDLAALDDDVFLTDFPLLLPFGAVGMADVATHDLAGAMFLLAVLVEFLAVFADLAWNLADAGSARDHAGRRLLQDIGDRAALAQRLQLFRGELERTARDGFLVFILAKGRTRPLLRGAARPSVGFGTSMPHARTAAWR